jgi:hypothetical protein
VEENIQGMPGTDNYFSATIHLSGKDSIKIKNTRRRWFLQTVI